MVKMQYTQSLANANSLSAKFNQESNECQKNQQDLMNLDLEVYWANIQLQLNKLRNSAKNQSFLMASGGFFDVHLVSAKN